MSLSSQRQPIRDSLAYKLLVRNHLCTFHSFCFRRYLIHVFHIGLKRFPAVVPVQLSFK